MPEASTRTEVRVVVVGESATRTGALRSRLEAELPRARVSVATGDDEALARITEDCDVVVVDGQPEQASIRTVAHLRLALPDRAVVVWSEGADPGLVLDALAAGADEVVDGAPSLSLAVESAVWRRFLSGQPRPLADVALVVFDALESPACGVDRDGTVVIVNRAWRAFGLANGGDPARTGVGMNYLDVCLATEGTDKAHAEQVRRGLAGVLAGQLPRFELDYACHSPVQERWFNLRIAPLPATSGAALLHVDVTESKRTERLLEHRSLHDPLTELPNRNLLDDRLERALAAATRGHRPVAVAFLDLDHFKSVNDRLGHEAGDQLLQAVAGRLTQHLRAGDTLARFAGDEFVVLWPSVESPQEAEHLAQRLLTAFEAPFSLTAATLSVTACVGVAVASPPRSPESLLREADAAMYAAKSRGAGQLGTSTPRMTRDLEARDDLRDEIAHAVASEQFAVYYQPVVGLADGAMMGYEALLRWHHRDGLLLPGAFLPDVEGMGLMVPLGAWALNEACREAASWPDERKDLHIEVNLSTRQVLHPDLVPTVERALESSGLSPHRLLLEVTGATVAESESAVTALTQLSGLGARVAIDHFGDGVSSLHLLRRCKIDVIKVDPAFVAGLGVTDRDDAIVTGIVTLAHAVGATCIAAGVETHEQYAALRADGCDGAQGFAIAPPAPVA